VVTFSSGYLANLAFIPAFLGAVAMLDEDRPRSTVLAALLLGAGGLAHPLFFLIGALVLLVAAVGTARVRPGEARRLAGAVIGGGARRLALLSRPRPPVDTMTPRMSVAHELRRTNCSSPLTRYVQWSSPACLLGAPGAEGTSGDPPRPGNHRVPSLRSRAGDPAHRSLPLASPCRCSPRWLERSTAACDQRPGVVLVVGLTCSCRWPGDRVTASLPCLRPRSGRHARRGSRRQRTARIPVDALGAPPSGEPRHHILSERATDLICDVVGGPTARPMVRPTSAPGADAHLRRGSDSA
jgi:hypothetical protein